MSAALTDLGLRRLRDGWGPCPACHAETRSDSERPPRGPLALRQSDTLVWCHRCQRQMGVRAVYALARREVPRLPPAPPAARAGSGWPDRYEVAEVWERARAVRDPVVQWLRSRAIDPDRTVGTLVRCLPGGELPRWASHWRALGDAALLPLYDLEGRVRCLHARRVRPGPDGTPKSVGARSLRDSNNEPIPGIRAGLVYATPEALRWLDTTHVLAEGEPDYLTHAQHGGSVWGIPAAGAWTGGHGGRLRGHLLIRTHDDDAGHGYAAHIARTLTHATYQRRPTPSETAV